MHMNMKELSLAVDAGAATIHGQDWAGINVAHIQFPKGTDARPLLAGLPGDMCQAPHWGLVLKGSIHVKYGDGKEEIVRAGEVYYWPAPHAVWVDEDYAALEFSRADEMGATAEHLRRKLAAMASQASAAAAQQQPGAVH